jgi:hypothetical protein
VSTEEAAERLVEYIKSRPDFIYHKCDDPYGHMGATIADSILQANNRYTSVTPRIERILRKWPDATTVTAMLTLLASVPATQFLNWQGQERADRFREVLYLLKKDHVDSESDFRAWLENDINLLKLEAISGIGPKTVDYFRMMVGLQGVAIDRRLLKFLGMAGIPVKQRDYFSARSVVSHAADLLSIKRADLDHSIWRYIGDREGSACA